MRSQLARRSSLLRLVAVAAALCVVGCSLLVNTSERTQCHTNADCEAVTALRGRVCSSGFCVVDVETGVVNADAGNGCTTTKRCTLVNSGRASVCKKAGGPCVPWVTDECPSIGGNWQDPNAIVIGTLLPLHVLQGDGTQVAGPYSKRVLRAIDLGLEELGAVVTAGLAVPGGPPRPVAVLHCDTSGDRDTAKRLYDHLTKVAGAEAIIVGWDEDLVAIAELAKADQTALVCSDCLATFPGLDGLPTGWKILPSIKHDVPLVAWRVADLEKRIKAVDPSDISVAVITEPYRVQREFSDALTPRLSFNKLSPVANGPKYLAIETPDPRVAKPIDWTPFVTAITKLAPAIVVVGMSSDFPTYLLPLIESSWPAAKPRPYYVLTQLAYEAAPYEGKVDDALRARISGTRPAATAPLQANIDAFELGYAKLYSEPADGSYSGYEAFYATAYALVAASLQPGPSPLDGAHISLGFGRLVSGTTIDVGKSLLPTALALLGKPGGAIDLRGLDSELDWDPVTHEIATDMEMFCFGKVAETGALKVSRATDVRYDVKAQQITGTYSCE